MKKKLKKSNMTETPVIASDVFKVSMFKRNCDLCLISDLLTRFFSICVSKAQTFEEDEENLFQLQS